MPFCNLLLYNKSLQYLVASNKKQSCFWLTNLQLGKGLAGWVHHDPTKHQQPNCSGRSVSKMARLRGCQVSGVVSWEFIWGCWPGATPWGWLGFLTTGWLGFQSKCSNRPRWKMQEFLWTNLRSSRIFLCSIQWSSKPPRQTQIQGEDCHRSIRREEKNVESVLIYYWYTCLNFLSRSNVLKGKTI